MSALTPEQRAEALRLAGEWTRHGAYTGPNREAAHEGLLIARALLAAEAEVAESREKNEKLSALIIEAEASFRDRKQRAEGEMRRLREELRKLRDGETWVDRDEVS